MILNRIKNAFQSQKIVGCVLDRSTDTRCIENQKADIIKHIENGISIRVLAKLIDSNPQTLSEWLIQNQSDTDIQKALIKALIEEDNQPGISSIIRYH